MHVLWTFLYALRICVVAKYGKSKQIFIRFLVYTFPLWTLSSLFVTTLVFSLRINNACYIIKHRSKSSTHHIMYSLKVTLVFFLIKLLCAEFLVRTPLRTDYAQNDIFIWIGFLLSPFFWHNAKNAKQWNFWFLRSFTRLLTYIQMVENQD